MYCMTNTESRTNITMSMDIIDWLDKFLKTTKAKQMGLKSRPDVFTMLLREFLTKEFPINNLPNGRTVIVKDEKNRNYMEIEILEDDNIFCNDCKLNDCEHVQRIKSDKKLLKQLKKT